MMKISVLAVLFLCAGVLAAQAPPAPPVTPTKFAYYSAAELKAQADTLRSGKPITWNRIHRGDHIFQNLNFLTKSAAAPEMHDNWTDLYFILDGEVIHHTGGKLEGATERTPGSGEWGGGKIVGGSAMRLGAGDIASSAAGVPHQWEMEPGKTMTYFVIKILKQPNLQARVAAPGNTTPLTPTQWVHYKAADLKNISDGLKQGKEMALPRVHRGDHIFQNLNLLTKSAAAPEMHNNWADLYYILDGEAAIRYGDRLEGGKEGPDGEVRGGEIVGNVTVQKLSKGDFASSPAGIPHMWIVEPGKTMTYVVLKLGKQHQQVTSNAR